MRGLRLSYTGKPAWLVIIFEGSIAMLGVLAFLSCCSAPDHTLEGVPAPHTQSWQIRLLPRHRQPETLLRRDHVIVIVLLQIDLDPVHLATELIVSGVVVR